MMNLILRATYFTSFYSIFLKKYLCRPVSMESDGRGQGRGRTQSLPTTARDRHAGMEVDGTSPASTVASVRDQTYNQCKSAREAASKVIIYNLSRDDNCMSEEIATVKSYGTTEGGAECKNFSGSRLTHAGTDVHQSISCSFDPANLKCITCDLEHSIVNAQKTLTLCIADQHFVPDLSGGAGGCISVARMEDASLPDLVTFCLELLDRQSPPSGSIILLGSATFLMRHGVTCYAQEWVNAMCRLKSRWPDITVLPLVPIPLFDCEVGLARDLCELATWLRSVYAESTHGLSATWQTAVKLYNKFSDNFAVFDVSEYYNIALPESLSKNAKLVCFHFKADSSRPETLKAFDLKATNELLTSLLLCLEKDFHVIADPELLLRREPTVCPMICDDESAESIIIVGASIMKKVAVLCKDSVENVHDHTVSGWIASPSNISKVCEELDITLTVADAKTLCVLDFLSNSTFRYTLYDGTQSLPMRLQSGYHLPGDVVICDNNVIVKLVDNVMPLITKLGGMPMVIIPPLPRYIFSGCCDDAEHCTNVSHDGYQETVLDGLTRIRNCLVKELRVRGLVNFWVTEWADVCGCDGNSSKKDVLTALKKVVANDAVHFNENGYTFLKNEILKSWKMLNDRKESVLTKVSSKSFYWRGFVSRNGSRTHKEAATHSFKRRGARSHPYRRN